MKRFFCALAAVSLLAACNDEGTAAFHVTFDTEDSEAQRELLLASVRVMERRADNLEATLIDQQIDPKTGLLSVTLNDKTAAEILTRQMSEPFTLSIMKEVPPEQAEKTIEGQGSFASTGITQDHITWVEAQEHAATKQGAIRIVFTEEGRKILQETFSENQGKSIAIFVRDVLVSKLQVSGQLLEEVVIRSIPSAEMARIFADDVNVGLHVTFTPAS